MHTRLIVIDCSLMILQIWVDIVLSEEMNLRPLHLGIEHFLKEIAPLEL
jgi:hypothetical protein